jgi:hypothetical protein
MNLLQIQQKEIITAHLIVLSYIKTCLRDLNVVPRDVNVFRSNPIIKKYSRSRLKVKVNTCKCAEGCDSVGF